VDQPPRPGLLPRPLLYAIAILGASFLAAGLCLEWISPEFLNRHPFSTNLIASIVGFSAVTLVAGVGFTVIANEAAQRAYRRWSTDRFMFTGWVNSAITSIVRDNDDLWRELRERRLLVADSLPYVAGFFKRRDPIRTDALERCIGECHALFTQRIQPYVADHYYRDNLLVNDLVHSMRECLFLASETWEKCAGRVPNDSRTDQIDPRTIKGLVLVSSSPSYKGAMEQLGYFFVYLDKFLVFDERQRGS
jgi:hypothetical protein